MKLKCIPEDFQVDEQTLLQPGEGEFALYRLTKRSVGTPEALDLISRRWHVARNRISYGGLKDRHAVTTQYVTIRRGPQRGLEQGLTRLEYLGQLAEPFTPKHIAGNRFRIVMRDLSRDAADRATLALQQLSTAGLPNYFDDQRFGSWGESKEFIAAAWCRGDYERALWLALADASPDDRSDDKKQKQILRETWGQWDACKQALARSSRRSIVTYLCDHPTDFRRAFALQRADMRSLYLSAFQSHLWNQLLSAWLQKCVPAEHLHIVDLKTAPVVFHDQLPVAEAAAFLATELPLPSVRSKHESEPFQDLLTTLLQPHGLALSELRVKYPRDSFFSKGSRAAIVFPSQPTHSVTEDDRYPKRWKMDLAFDLPRGSYATILIKRLTEIRGGQAGRITDDVGDTPVETGDDDVALSEMET